MGEIRSASPNEADRIHPYMGGDELNSSPTLAYRRWVINLNDVKDEVALECQCPKLAAIVREKVKPERDMLGPNPNNVPLKQRWWAYQGHRPTFYAAATHLERVIAVTAVAPHLSFAFLPTRMIYANSLYLFTLSTFSAFCALQSRPHEIWTRFFGSTLEDRLRYTPSDCFETFPFPTGWVNQPAIEAAGKAYYEFRAALMVKNDEGLTKTYNRFHDPDGRDPDILLLRELHSAMDRAVLDAYGWIDIPTACEFLLDYEIEEEEWGDKKKPYRYRWPDKIRDEVLARLLELNAERAKEEASSGAAATKKRGNKAGAKHVHKASDTEDLFS